MVQFDVNSKDMPSLSNLNMSVHESFITDYDFILKQVIADVTTNNGKMNVHSQIIDMASKAGAPDNSFFDMPADWSNCEKTPLPAMPPLKIPMARAFLHCAGLGP